MFSSKPDYQQSLKWSNQPHEKVLISWDIKKIIHNWVKPVIVMGGFTFTLMNGVILLIYFLADPKAVPVQVLLIASLVCTSFWGIILYLEVCRKNQLVYRLTNKTVELQRWRVYPDFLFSWSKGMLVLIGVIALLIGIFSKTGILTIIGPVSIVFAQFIKVTTPEYKRMMVNHRNDGAFWPDIKRFQYDPTQKLVRLDYEFDVSEEEIQKQLSRPNVYNVGISGEYDLFMTQDNEQQVLAILKQYLPHLPLETTALELPDSDI